MILITLKSLLRIFRYEALSKISLEIAKVLLPAICKPLELKTKKITRAGDGMR